MDDVNQVDEPVTKAEDIPQLENGHCSCDYILVSMDPDSDFYGICLECGYDHINSRFVSR